MTQPRVEYLERLEGTHTGEGVLGGRWVCLCWLAPSQGDDEVASRVRHRVVRAAHRRRDATASHCPR
jgi:hypothetical protein